MLVTLVNAEYNYTFRTRPRADGFDMETYAQTGSSYQPKAASFNFSAWGTKS